MWFPILNIGKVLTDNLLDIYFNQDISTKIGGYWGNTVSLERRYQ